MDSYTHIHSNKTVRAIQYDGSVNSLYEIAGTFGMDITFTSRGIYINGSFVKLGYYVVFGDGVYSYTEKNFKKLYIKYIPQRKFKMDGNIIREVWMHTQRYSSAYQVNVDTNCNKFLEIITIATGDKITISDIITLDISKYPGSHSIVNIVLNGCEEICN